MHSRLDEPVARQFEQRGPLGASYVCVRPGDATSTCCERVANQVYCCHCFCLGTSALPAGCVELIGSLVEEELRLRVFDDQIRIR